MTEGYRQGFLLRCRRAGLDDAQAMSLLSLIPLVKGAASDPCLQQAEAVFKDWLAVPKHQMRPGEVLAGVARKYGVGLQDLMKYNGMKTPFVRTGQTIRIPPKKQNGTEK